MSNTIVVYYENKLDNDLSKVYTFPLNTKIIEIKSNILADFPKDGYNYIDLDYVSERIYKEMGKYFFAKGVVPRTMDNVELEQFSNGGKTYHFYIHYDNFEQEIPCDKPKRLNLGFLSERNNREPRIYPERVVEEKPKFNYETDFPTLSLKR